MAEELPTARGLLRGFVAIALKDAFDPLHEFGIWEDGVYGEEERETSPSFFFFDIHTILVAGDIPNPPISRPASSKAANFNTSNDLDTIIHFTLKHAFGNSDFTPSEHFSLAQNRRTAVSLAKMLRALLCVLLLWDQLISDL
ncbi:DEAD-box ATP-dependent RNA helicase 21 [Striga asiatica]|uniref:DEAD-box ATP-dependent RNA helicase 21 n=1 Tax=Striga asiatica TaxID=4170 RepID=A0A5A7QTQ9_STRAF|nr:DEAD-box ATP-dependent RNA helicase 21 [Striga asiatica]